MPSQLSFSARATSFLLHQARLLRLAVLFLFCATAAPSLVFAEEDLGPEERRRLAKPWYSQRIDFMGVKLPITPVTLGTFVVSLLYLLSSWKLSSSKYCVASHILLMDHNEETEKKLEGFKKAIGKDEKLFAKYAKKYSACPSKQQGGNLGKFKPQVMAPPFDKACFDPKSPEQTTIGPIHTTFGWHLIYIHERKLE